MTAEACSHIQLIDGEGVLNEDSLAEFVKAVKLSQHGLSYAVVSIMGPQSSGKSTLLNHLFDTNFREMDAFEGRSQTTQGVWLSKAVGIEPFTLVMDLEGTDGSERGEDNTTFEKQSALFALAVSNIVLINMWCHDIGREQAANKPLMKTVFQAMMRLFDPRKITLLFVIRDKTKTPLERLEQNLHKDIQKIWDSVLKPPTHQDTPFSEFFNVEVTALPSYEVTEELFKEQVSSLRKRFFNSTARGGLAGDRRAVVPASVFPLSIKEFWKIIKENKDLDLPTHKVMVATVRCEEIAKEMIDQLTNDEHWQDLEQLVQSAPVPGFGRRVSALLDRYISRYDSEALYFEETVRDSKRQNLVTESLNLVYPAYKAMLGHLCSKVLTTFKAELKEAVKNGKDFAAAVECCTKFCKEEFDQGCVDAEVQQANWGSTKIKIQSKLWKDICSHAASMLQEENNTLQEANSRLNKEKILKTILAIAAVAGSVVGPTIAEVMSSNK